MVRLAVPGVAYRPSEESRHSKRPGRWRWHFKLPGSDFVTDEGQRAFRTACRDTYILYDELEEAPLEEIPPDMMCKMCCGPMVWTE